MILFSCDLSGEGSLFVGDFSFWSGGGSPLVGEKRAFMAEPSDRPAINDSLFVGKKGGCKYEIKKNK